MSYPLEQKNNHQIKILLLTEKSNVDKRTNPKIITEKKSERSYKIILSEIMSLLLLFSMNFLKVNVDKRICS